MKIARIIDQEDRQVQAAVSTEGKLFRLDATGAAGTIITDEIVTPKRWLTPVEARVIYCIGVNYSQHAREAGHDLPEYPIVFMKNLGAAVGHQEPIRLPAVCGDEVDYEGELAVVIGAPCRNVVREEALQYVLGYTVANDVSARLWQKERGGSQWCRGKGFDTFAPLGPWLVTADEIPNPNDLTIKTVLNDQIMQEDTTANMIFDVPALISFLSEDTTLLPGTVILTGTPEGVGWSRDPKRLLQPGDTVTVEIEGIGMLTNPVIRSTD